MTGYSQDGMHNGNVTEGEEEDLFGNSISDALTIGVPLAVVVVVVMVLCMVMLYSKARRRRAAQRGRRNSLTAISGGVALNANAYLNFASRDRGNAPSLGDGSIQPVSEEIPHYEAPPSYEDAMKDGNMSSSSGLVNMSFTHSTENLQEQEAPPPPYYTRNSGEYSPQQAGPVARNDANNRNVTIEGSLSPGPEGPGPERANDTNNQNATSESSLNASTNNQTLEDSLNNSTNNQTIEGSLTNSTRNQNDVGIPSETAPHGGDNTSN